MEENKYLDSTENAELQSQEEESSFNLKNIITLVILNWQWFLASVLVFLCCSFLYLRYVATPVYQVSARMLIKDENNPRRSNGQMLANMQDLGFITNSAGIDNEVEILQSRRIALEAVNDLKLYTEYYTKGTVKKELIYQTHPFYVDLDPAHLDSLNEVPSSFYMEIERNGNNYSVDGVFNDMTKDDAEASKRPFKAEFSKFPAVINTPGGTLTFTENDVPEYKLTRSTKFVVTIQSPKLIASGYASQLSVEPTSKITSIALLTLKDRNPQRAYDFLLQLATCYNRQANADKNEIAYKTEEFINSRIEKINGELGATEDELEDYKKRHNLVQLKLDATQTLAQQAQYYDKLTQANTQLQLITYLQEYVNNPENRYQIIPSNVGLNDNVSATLINEYNRKVQERNLLLSSVSENAPQVVTLNNTLDRLQNSIKDAFVQARRSADIQRQSVQQQFNLYQSKVSSSPEQERILTQIGRQQEVKSGLYLMLLQKREENSISLAATADKGKLIDDPVSNGKVSPKSAIIMLAALVFGFALPLGILFLLQLLRYKIEGHDDVARLTRLPIIADVAVASESAKGTAGIVVKENENNQIDEIFRGMRTNIQFMMKKDDKTILFTSSASGEGKTFNAANLGMSFALLGKKVILMGLDIRKPALGRLFNIADRNSGISTLLVKGKVTESDVMAQISPSGVNGNLDLLLAGPTPPNPAELLARENLSDIMSILREKYDYIIMDTAPVGLVTDTLQIGKYADVTIFVCRADFTPKSSFGLVNSLAAEEKLPNMCMILNGVDMSKKKYGYYYGYGKYGHYSHYGNYGSRGYYGNYGSYSNSHYGNKEDDSIKR